METCPNVQKRAFIARLNDRAGRVVVDTYYARKNGRDVLMIVYDDGSEREFKGLRAA